MLPILLAAPASALLQTVYTNMWLAHAGCQGCYLRLCRMVAYLESCDSSVVQYSYHTLVKVH